MADRYQNRAFPAGDGYDRGMGSRAPGNAESDPLAELARLIGQTDPFGTGTKPMSRANLPSHPPTRPTDPEPSQDSYQDGYQDNYYADSEPDEPAPPAPPSWMQRAARHEPPPPPPQEDYPSAVHPLHRYAAAHPPAEADYEADQGFADSQHEQDPSRYDDALYGSFESGAQHGEHNQGYGEDSYGYDEDQHYEEQPEPRRRGGMITVAAVLALAVFGVGGAFAYRTYTGRGHSGEPPIIRADTGPTKIIPAPADAAAKVPDRMAIGDGTEKIVSREETPIDPNTVRPSGPRVVFPPLTQNGSAPMPTTIVPGAPPPTTSGANGTFTNNEPHQVRTVTVRQDPSTSGTPTGATPPAPAPTRPASRAVATPRVSASNPSAANANGPLSLAPQGEASAAQEPVRMAATNPTQMVPSAPSPAAASGGYLVQVSSQSSESEAQASYKMLQSKYPSVLGAHAPVIKRAEIGEKVVYRAMVGPFGSSAEASQFCGSLKSAGGQCLIHRN